MDWLLQIPGWEWWDMHFKYLRSKPVSPNNCNSMFIPSLRLQPAQFPSRLWCIWKGFTEKFKARKVTAGSQWRKEDRHCHHQRENKSVSHHPTPKRWKEREANACSGASASETRMRGSLVPHITPDHLPSWGISGLPGCHANMLQ